MLNFHDTASTIDEPKTARMEQRTKPHVKAQIQRAAALLGVDETTFVISVVLERTGSVIADHERTVLAAGDRDVILAALDAPTKSTDALRQAMALHGAWVVHGG